MNYKIIDQETYYRKEIFRHFSEDCMCSSSMTARINVTNLVSYSKHTNTKFYINFLYILSKKLIIEIEHYLIIIIFLNLKIAKSKTCLILKYQ